MQRYKFQFGSKEAFDKGVLFLAASSTHRFADERALTITVEDLWVDEVHTMQGLGGRLRHTPNYGGQVY